MFFCWTTWRSQKIIFMSHLRKSNQAFRREIWDSQKQRNQICLRGNLNVKFGRESTLLCKEMWTLQLEEKVHKFFVIECHIWRRSNYTCLWRNLKHSFKVHVYQILFQNNSKAAVRKYSSFVCLRANDRATPFSVLQFQEPRKATLISTVYWVLIRNINLLFIEASKYDFLRLLSLPCPLCRFRKLYLVSFQND